MSSKSTVAENFSWVLKENEKAGYDLVYKRKLRETAPLDDFISCLSSEDLYRLHLILREWSAEE